jgi:hypothetical protein
MERSSLGGGVRTDGSAKMIGQTALIDVSDWWPLHIAESAWLEHTPFAAWLISTVQPEVLVELGTHRAVSYMAFCQAISRSSKPARCFAIDTWQGDEHAGKYSEDVFQSVTGLNQKYDKFSTLLRFKFDEALEKFDDGSIDVLHIDGFHSYEAVSHDFYSWFPKMSETGVVLFHDTVVRTKDFGVWRFWAEISQKYPHFEFKHGFGLGVLAVGSRPPPQVQILCGLTAEPARSNEVRSVFADRGRQITATYQRELDSASPRYWWTPLMQKTKKLWRATIPLAVREFLFNLRKKI